MTQAPDPLSSAEPGQAPLDAPIALPLEEVSAAASAELQATPERRFGEPGGALDRRTPFFIGFTAAFGVAAAALLVWMVYTARGLFTDVGLALFIALGLDPVVAWLQRRGLPRWAAVLAVVIGGLAVLAGIASEVVPVATQQATDLVNQLPHYEHELNNHSSTIGRLNQHYHVVSRIQHYLTTNQSKLAGGFVGVGRAVLSGILEIFIITVVSIYFLADLPRVKRTIYQLVPRSRRARVVLLGDEIFAKVGGYVLGNVLVSVIAGAATWIWAFAFGIPYPLLLATVVAVLDLVPLVGSTVGGIIVALVALTISLPLAIATAAFYLAFRLLEDYLLTPRIMRSTVEVPAIVTVIATLLGGAILGIVGALVAIPVAAAIKLLAKEITMPNMNRR